jgi:hypothetical protein
MHLSVSPTRDEVKAAVKRLKLGRAPGSNSLTADLFRKGGESLLDRLVNDFAIIWPEVDEDGQLNPKKMYSEWQNASVVTIFKKKSSRADPNNFRGIFLLDVAGKILASVLDAWIKQVFELWISNSQVLRTTPFMY